MNPIKTYDQLVKENESLHWQLEEATDIIHAIRTGQIDALVVKKEDGHELYTLKTADQTYRVFIEKMNEGAVTLNNEGIILYCNSMFASMVNVPLSKVIGLSFDTFIPKECLEDYKDIFKKGWTQDGKFEISISSHESLIPCQLSVTTLELDEGVSLSIIITDLSYQKEIQRLLKLNNERLESMNAALEISNHDLQQFASVASHDLQEPLRKILIFSGLLKSRHMQELPEESLQYLEKIIASSGRMKTMIIDILTYSGLSVNDNHFEQIELNVVINEVLEDFEILINEKGATFEIGELPVVEVNKGQIRQVFQNLIGNALKFSKPDEPPVIRIEALAGDDNQSGFPSSYCRISVSDNGIGFDEKYGDKIFSLFQRLNTKDKYEGSGIGLAITKKILDKHNGIITASSRENIGSEFIVCLPYKQKTEEESDTEN
ncbi:PAS domain S-box-containing protein [Dyadobacter koreensis]|uniref:histidine kinase n=1 Tax=Dyadobacter koreensis TaxID=408657 RepID=A0A1H7AK63_9BACT|nr:ATP-binding protein [Dyadobacter koreensis]SEJ61405.1 PAS domain S-box-containing protein [Dyadobacter koreensis]